VTVSIRPLRPDDIDVVVEFSLRAWQPVFESFRQVMGAEIYRRIYPDWKTIQAKVVASSCRAEGNRVWVAEADARPVGYTVARRLYERAGFTPVPLVRYFKALP
jgi:hypothetical protein